MSAAQWEAEVLVDAGLARHAIARAFSELAALPVRALGEGWDNAAFLVGERYVFRFPRRAIGAELMEMELCVLPVIAPQLPLPVPVPRFVSKMDDTEWPFAGYEILPGRAISSTQRSEVEYQPVAADVGGFLRALHGIPARTVPGLGGDRIGRLDHGRCMPKAMQRLRALQDAGVIESTTAFEEVLELNAPSTAALRASAQDDTAQSDGVVVHGDLYGRHILVDADGRACGIIDWGDVHAGDPAVDLAAAFEVFPPAARDAFFEAYGDVNERTKRLARYRGAYHSAMVAHYGWRIGDEELLRAGLDGLSSCLV